jgi:hypothetical protein
MIKINLKGFMMFKVGDWVREDFGDMNIVQIKEKFITNDGGVYINNLNSELFSKWQPKEGEFVIPKILDKKTGTYISGIEIRMWTNGDTYACEPFIGELPSFLNDSR